MNRQHFAVQKILTAAIYMCLIAQTSVMAKWSFGVMSDNHLTVGKAQTINLVNAQFIEKKVKFVIQVGDMTNAGVDPAVGAVAAQQLIDAGIGFFPVRANHEAYPQSTTSTNIGIFKEKYPQTQGLSNTFGATNFSSPVEVNEELKGLSYSFDYSADGASARCVLIDDWANSTIYDVSIAATSPYGNTVVEQQGWISSRLDKSTRGTEHAFVFSHHNLIGENHKDCLFKLANENTNGCQDLFFSALGLNDVKFYISGHEHVYNRSIITSPDGNNHVWDIISAPAGTARRAGLVVGPADPMFFGQKGRQMQVTQEYDIVGFSIYTIDGPQVTVDYYSAPYAPPTDNMVLNFVKKETFGYSLNGKEFLVAQSASYNAIADNFEGTTARILSGTNTCAATDFEGRALTKSVTTGWTSDDNEWMCCSHDQRHCGRGHDKSHHCNCSRHHQNDRLLSNIITLWGMADFGTDQTDVFALSMSYEKGRQKHIDNGQSGIAVQDSVGNWVNAVDMNFGGSKKFFRGQWKAEYGLGAYGVDPCTKTVWAVLNYNDDFTVAKDIETESGYNHHGDNSH